MARIFTSRKSGFIQRAGRMRRETVWLFDTSGVIGLAAGANPVLVGSLNASALALRPFTIVRSRGFVYVGSDQEAADEF